MQQGTQQGVLSYAVDLVMCIDGTGSMAGMIDEVKKKALGFWTKFYDAMIAEHKSIRDDWFRVKVIVFRDYKDDGESAMEESEFFKLSTPEGVDAFNEYIRNIEPHGGGDDPENALEAIFTAIKSDWVRQYGRFRRHAILLFTDAAALSPQDKERLSAPNYPYDMPRTRDELAGIFENGDGGQSRSYGNYSADNGRLIVYAPKNCGWEWLNTIDRAWWVPVDAKGGCSEVMIEEALKVLTHSLAASSLQ